MTETSDQSGKLPVARKGAGSRRVYETLRERILTLELAPGFDLEESALVVEFNVSRTPIREALIRLSTDKLVRILPNRGARVAELPLSSIGRFFESLSLVQRAITRWAAARSTPMLIRHAQDQLAFFEESVRLLSLPEIERSNRDFHLAIAELADNPYMKRIYRELLDEGMRLSYVALSYDPIGSESHLAHLDTIMSDHRQIIEAVRERDVDRAEKIAGDHAELFRQRILLYLGGHPTHDISVDLASK